MQDQCRKTPRTDGVACSADLWLPDTVVVGASMARQLETELAEALAEIKRLKYAMGQCALCQRG